MPKKADTHFEIVLAGKINDREVAEETQEALQKASTMQFEIREVAE